MSFIIRNGRFCFFPIARLAPEERVRALLLFSVREVLSLRDALSISVISRCRCAQGVLSDEDAEDDERPAANGRHVRGERK